MLVSGSYFPVLGLSRRSAGCSAPSDDRTPAAHRSSVLSHAYWRTPLRREPGVLGRR